MQIRPTKEAIRELPSFMGVYLFEQKGKPIYVGKSVNIKSRLLSHLEGGKLSTKEEKLFTESDSIDCIQTDSEFKALLLESELIKTHHPRYNVRWKDDKSYLYIKISIKDLYPKVLIARKERDTKSRYFGPFSSTQSVHQILREVRKVIPFDTQPKIGRSPCFYTKIGLCNPCPNVIEKITDQKEKAALKREYRKNIRALIQLLEGDIEKVQKNLYKKMRALTNEQEYEQALQVRNHIYRLESLSSRQRFDPNDQSSYNQSRMNTEELLHLLHLHFPQVKTVDRIECYDISNLSQKQATASMVVFTNGEPDKSQYRKFRIKDLRSSSDFEMLEETLKRRFKNKWKKPDLLVVDGGKPQVRTFLRVITELNLTIPLVGLAKNPDRLVIGTENLPTVRPKLQNPGFNMLRYMRDEAHRFAKKYHLQLRERGALF